MHQHHLRDHPGQAEMRIGCGKWRERATNFVAWLSTAEKTLSDAKQVPLVLERVLAEIGRHESFEKEVNQRKADMDQLVKNGTHLHDKCFHQDENLIKDLISRVQLRWEMVLSKFRERSRALDIGYKQAKDYENSWRTLVSWLEGTERALDYLAKQMLLAANNQKKLEFLKADQANTQRGIKGKKGQYDSVVCSGTALRAIAPKDDEPELEKMADRLKELWSTVSSKAEKRQHDLDQALENLRKAEVSPKLQTVEPPKHDKTGSQTENQEANASGEETRNTTSIKKSSKILLHHNQDQRNQEQKIEN